MGKKVVKSYHHGDLFRTLVIAGTEIVESHGVEAISLRQVARQALVSHAAPYHYFRNKSALLAAIATAGFDDLVREIRSLIETCQPDDALEPLRCVGRGYLQFALRRPALFRLMFRPELTNPNEHAELKEAEGRAFGTLYEAVQAFLAQTGALGADARAASACCWSTVHGLAILHIDAVLAETPVGELPLDKLAATIIEFAVAGIQHSMHG